ncbi:MAG: tRNA (adenosine(37)-N6)-threonylcarbamoyltransferase complex dimerization subunit type 1 TsaB [Fibrobacterota bacterium]
MTMRNVLVLNSCLPPLLAAVVCDKEPVSLLLAENETAFSRQGMGLIKKALAQAGLGPADIDAAVFVAGPGSFTGIRIGLSMLKGLAFGRTLPVALLNALEILAAPFFRTQPRPVCPVIDAHLGEVYAALYSPDGAELAPPRALPPDALAASLSSEVLFSGKDAEKFREHFSGLIAEYGAPDADAIMQALLHRGRERVEAGETIALRDAQPLYLRLSYAEMKRVIS